jgi:hypothetical protein
MARIMVAAGRKIGPFIYPIFLAIYPVLFLFARNRAQTRPTALGWPILAAVGFTVLIWATARLWLRNKDGASLATAAILVAFFGYGQIFMVVYAWTVNIVSGPADAADPARYERQLQWLLGAVMLFMLSVVLYAIRHSKEISLVTWSRGLTAFATTLLTLATGTAFLPGVRNEDVPTAKSAPIKSLRPTSRLGYAPDIYEIVLDGYARKDVLARHYRFDNRTFLNALSEQGFDVLGRSRSNFNWTFLSLASMLNMRYVDDLGRDPGPDSVDRERAFGMLRDSEVARFLRQRGYTTIHLASTWAGTLENRSADLEIPCTDRWFQDNFYRSLAESSLLRLWRSRVTMDLASCHLAQMGVLANIAYRPGPKFVFAHFVPPHHPYLFDQNGKILVRATVADQFDFNRRLWALRDAYRDQLIYMNRRIERIVREIAARSGHPPIIIVHSDHGPELIDSRGQVDKDNINARFATLLAIRTPGAHDLLPEDVTLVNVYRLLFNHYFDAGLRLLDAKYYYSPFDRPYAFERVTIRDVSARSEPDRATHPMPQ